MSRSSNALRKFAVLLMALVMVVAYTVAPMNQVFAASKPAKVSGVKATAASTTSIKVTWKKAKNAKKYVVYRATSKSGKYKKVATTKSKAYTVKKLASGKKYYFKVRGLNGKTYGKYSKVVSATTKKAAKPVKEIKATLGDKKTQVMTVDINLDKAGAKGVQADFSGKTVKAWIPVPQSDEYQTISDVTFDAPNAKVAKITTEKAHGNKMLYLEFDAASKDRNATLSYLATRVEVSKSLDGASDKYGIPADVKKYITEESEYVKWNNPIVKKYAAEATKGKTTTVEKARAIYEWEIAHLERIDHNETVVSADGDTTHRFKVEGCGYGDTVKILTDYDKYGFAGGHCTDLNSTFVALCRAAGIPAREMFGIRMNADATGGQHCWTEFYAPGVGWTYVDAGDVLKQIKPAKGDNNTTDMAAWEAAKASDKAAEWTKYYWGHVDNNRIVLTRGRDITFEPAYKDGVKCNAFGYPAVEVEGYERADFDFTNTKSEKMHIDYKITCTDKQKVQIDASKPFITVDEAKAIIDGDAEGYTADNTVIAGVTYGKAGSEYVKGAKAVFSTEVEDANGMAVTADSEFNNAYNLLDMDTIRKAAAAHGITADTKVVVYADQVEQAGRQAYAYLLAGVKDVKIVNTKNALAALKAAGVATTAAPAADKAADFGTPATGYDKHLDSMKDVQKELYGEDGQGNNYETSNFKLVSVRAESEFKGESSGYVYMCRAGEPEGAVWGPGADTANDVNGYLNADGTVKTLDELTATTWKNVDFKTDGSDHLSFYCGTGWRATVPYFIMLQAGIDNVSIYDGGWYQWSMDTQPAYPETADKDHTPLFPENRVQVGDQKMLVKDMPTDMFVK